MKTRCVFALADVASLHDSRNDETLRLVKTCVSRVWHGIADPLALSCGSWVAEVLDTAAVASGTGGCPPRVYVYSASISFSELGSPVKLSSVPSPWSLSRSRSL